MGILLKTRGSVKTSTEDTLVGTQELQPKNKNKVLLQVKYKTKVENQLSQEWKDMNEVNKGQYGLQGQQEESWCYNNSG